MASRDDAQFKIRIPHEVKQRLEDSAKANRRSVTAEIENRLVNSFGAKAQIAPAFAELLETHIDHEVNARLRAIASSIGGTK